MTESEKMEEEHISALKEAEKTIAEAINIIIGSFCKMQKHIPEKDLIRMLLNDNRHVQILLEQWFNKYCKEVQ